ncbi:MAG: hypothetical protein K5784_08465 [Clostridiales bacterium]|nr:hypothetical protein [Clostridiales bacterium]
MDIRDIIAKNIETIESISEEKYPTLHHLLWHTTVFAHLKGMLEYMLYGLSAPVWPKRNPAFYFFSQDYCAKWCKANRRIGGAHVTWQSHKVFLYDMGLLKLFSVIGEKPDDEILDRAWQEAQRKNYRSTTFWSVNEYTDEVLRNAEEIALVYRNAKANLSHLRKADVIRVRGSKRANQLYKADAERVIGAEEKAVERILREFIESKLCEKGYTTIPEIMGQIDDFAIARIGFGITDATAFDRSEQDKKKHAYAFRNIMEKQRRFYLTRFGCRYAPISKKQREHFRLPAGMTCWLITKQG